MQNHHLQCVCSVTATWPNKSRFRLRAWSSQEGAGSSPVPGIPYSTRTCVNQTQVLFFAPYLVRAHIGRRSHYGLAKPLAWFLYWLWLLTKHAYTNGSWAIGWLRHHWSAWRKNRAARKKADAPLAFTVSARRATKNEAA